MISWVASSSPKRLRREGKDQNIISSSDKNLVRIQNPNNDLIVASMIVAKYSVKKIIDSGRSVNVLSYDAFI